MTKEMGATSRKIILLLETGLLLGLSHSPSSYFKIIKAAGKEWQDIESRKLHLSIKSLYRSKLIDFREAKDGTILLKLSEKGKMKVLKYKLDDIKIPLMKKWDGRWRVILFDIPESKKRIRDALRFHLKRMGFFEFQKSVFVHPFDCKNEADFLVEFYDIRNHVRFLTADSIDNELHLKNHFHL